jgi:hypothetical protein
MFLQMNWQKLVQALKLKIIYDYVRDNFRYIVENEILIFCPRKLFLKEDMETAKKKHI